MDEGQVEGQAAIEAVVEPVPAQPVTVATGIVPGKCPTCGRDMRNSG